MSTQPHKPLPAAEPDVAQSSASGPSLARRRLLRGGLGAAPVLLAAAPRSVMAGNCVTASAQTSYSPLQATSHQPTQYNCAGQSPDYWKINSWPAPYVKTASDTIPATKVKDVFSSMPWTTHSETTLLDALSMTDTTGERCMVKYMVAAALNAKQFSMPIGVADTSTILRIWSEYWSSSSNWGRFYVPTGTVRWYCDYSKPKNSGGITPWLKSTMSG